MAKAWYIVHTYSGYEQKIQRTIFKLREMDTDFALVVSDVKVPMETVTEIKDGKKKEVKRKILPGYILVEIDFPDDATWKNTYSKIKRIQGVTGFVSAMEGRKPQPLFHTQRIIFHFFILLVFHPHCLQHRIDF